MTHEGCPADFLLSQAEISAVCREQPLVPTSRNASPQQRRELGPPISGESAPFDTGGISLLS